MDDTALDFTIDTLGECRIPSPMKGARFTEEDEEVLYHSRLVDVKGWIDKQLKPPAMETAGPREMIFFDPSQLACGIVTCGGICPGLNDVIRSIVLSLYQHYGVRKVYGFRFGYEGLVQRLGHVPLQLTPDSVVRIHEMGGTILGSSRGPQDPGEMVKTLEDLKVGILFTVGGDGTLRGAQKVAEEAKRRGLPISVIGIPKTIDNDICFVQSTFGFETAVSEARRATYAAYSEAEAVRNGVGLVKLMGRDSGFIAAFAALADNHVNFCLIPEVPFTLEKFLGDLRKRLELEGHAVIVVAEGAGQDLMGKTGERDASGNVKYGDIGVFLRDAIKKYFQQAGMETNLKYIDPSYTIRSVPTNPHDSALCLLFGHNAVHAGMSGRTNMVVSFWNHQFTHVPISLAVSQRKKIDPESVLWSSVLASTGQSRDMCGPAR
ncbi:MAG: Pyrophosphate--fructose 6-phosphate 1-phosphotransferase [Syntrophorhabdus sp. PtaU1.Bin153]|nr:MAG: Pyrophosphate--fructose 6-phosphate 1-phosphotransferase [Syntrophorhabdus sp. PtaU1.Bin153]